MAYKFSKGKRGLGDIEFEDDADTGIDFEADSISLETGGAARLTVTNSTITTSVPLHISGSVTEGLRIAKGSGNYREIQFETDGVDTAYIMCASNNSLQIGCQSNNDEIQFFTTVAGSTTEAMRVTATKRVGINETNPQTALHISGDDPRVRIDGITDSHPGLELSEAGTRKWIVFNDYQNDNLTFKTDNNTRMVIKQGGNVGIGTDDPDYTLDVAGNIGVDQYIYHNGDGNTLINFADDKIILKAGGKAMITMEEKGSAPHEVTINDGSNNIDFVVKGNGSAGGNPGMKFDASNNRVGINGIGSPTCALDVNSDSIRIRTAKTPSNASDTGDAGQVCWDNNYLYICIATNTWKRVSLNTW